MSAVDFEVVRRRAQQMSRAEFASKYDQLYLVITGHLDEPPIEFATVAMSSLTFQHQTTRNPDGRSNVPQAALPVHGVALELLEVAKVPGAPFPDMIFVGRVRNCDIVMRDPSVSKLHAHFRRLESGRFELVDTGSQNGTRLNGELLQPNTPARVASGDSVVFGGVTSRLADANALFDLCRLPRLSGD